MRVKVIQHTDSYFSDVLEVTRPRNIAYCKKFKLDYQAYVGDFVPQEITGSMRRYWDKPYILKSILETEDYDWIFYLDADAMFVDAGFDLRSFIHLSDTNAELIVCYVNQEPAFRYWNFNFGVFFVKNTAYMNAVMDELIRICVADNGRLIDQHVFQGLLKENYQNIAQKTSIFPSVAFNHHGKFIYHAVGLNGWSNTGNKEVKIEQLKKLIQ